MEEKAKEVCGRAPRKRRNDRKLIRVPSSLRIRGHVCLSSGKSGKTAADWHTHVPKVNVSRGPRLLWRQCDRGAPGGWFWHI